MASKGNGTLNSVAVVDDNSLTEYYEKYKEDLDNLYTPHLPEGWNEGASYPLEDEYIKLDLLEETDIKKREANKFIKDLHEFGYDYEGIGYYSGMAELYIGNQNLSIDKHVLNSLIKGEYYMNSHEFLEHFAKHVPDVLKFYGGTIEIDNKNKGNY